MKLTEEQSQLVEKNHNLIYGFAHHRGLNIDEWYGQLAIELCKSVKCWNKNRSALSTYFYMRADTMLLLDHRDRNRQIRRANEHSSTLDIELLNHDCCDLHNEDVILDELYKHGDRKIIRMRYEGYTQEEIADEIGVTQPTVSRMLSRTLEEYKRGSDLDY